LIVSEPDSVIGDGECEYMVIEWLTLWMMIGCTEYLKEQWKTQFICKSTLTTFVFDIVLWSTLNIDKQQHYKIQRVKSLIQKVLHLFVIVRESLL